ncbi:GNAT superfamily N-acetyltransferase [Povalibacter uvarum]|uniref:GNAT superfamily N-acetyltransferase n=1 Tax=Povalibacter uvarum TaxID=732238 RepID=A0A841HL58_9GAMM|nr:GNAT family N-acetyltransferase [Povalibacter uvarum]MBB6093314.1 GNAT superfamily N-acetyltransferase [Povalibacter uvarum]
MTTPEFQIRRATVADVPTILSLIRELADFERLSHECVATEALLEESLFGPRPGAEVVIGQLGSEVVGFALFFPNFSTFLGRPGLYLEDLFVRPKYRGQGYGEHLLRHLASICVERDYGRLEWSVLDWNQRAIDFYKSLGAQPMDEWTVFRVTGDALTKLGSQ